MNPCWHWCAIGTQKMLIVWRLYSRIGLCIPRASPLPHPYATWVQKSCPTDIACTSAAVGPIGWFRWEATKQQCYNFEFTKWHDIYTPGERAEEWMLKSANLKWQGHEWFHHDHGGHPIGYLGTIVRRLNGLSVSSPGDVRGEYGLREIASVNQRTWRRNWHLANFSVELSQSGSIMAYNSNVLLM